MKKSPLSKTLNRDQRRAWNAWAVGGMGRARMVHGRRTNISGYELRSIGMVSLGQ